MSKSIGSSDEAIGRPAEWREGRYQERGKPVDDSVLPSDTGETASAAQPSPASDERVPPQPISTPVTREDYAMPDKKPRNT